MQLEIDGQSVARVGELPWLVSVGLSCTIVSFIRVHPEFHWLIHPTYSLTASVISIQSKWFCWRKSYRSIMVSITPTAKVNPCVSIILPTRNWLHDCIVISIILVIPVYAAFTKPRRTAAAIFCNTINSTRPRRAARFRFFRAKVSLHISPRTDVNTRVKIIWIPAVIISAILIVLIPPSPGHSCWTPTSRLEK